MSTEENKAAFRRWIELWNENNPDGLDEVTAVDIVTHHFSSDVNIPDGLEAQKTTLAEVHEAYKDSKIIIHDLFAEDDKVVAIMEQQAINVGKSPLLGLPPTNKPYWWRFCQVTRWEDGKMVELWNYTGPWE